MSRPVPETHLQYAQRVGAPRDVPCDIQLGPRHGFVWYCRSHDYDFDNPSPYERGHTKALRNDRCPISRLEEWRARAWEATA